MTGYSAKVLADSVAPGGERLTTVEATFPRFILAELNTHRILSKNSASSRAIPTAKLIEKVRDNPVLPAYYGKHQSGMQANEELAICDQGEAQWEIEKGAAVIADMVEQLGRIRLHKQNANRYIEPWMWHTAIISGTEWDNFFAQRDTWPDPSLPPGPAQPEFGVLARMIREAMEASTPRNLQAGEWHLPLVDEHDDENPLHVPWEDLWTLGISSADIPSKLCAISAARCARVSYLTHDGKRDIQADLDLHDRLVSSGHWSPLEHVARAMAASESLDWLDGLPPRVAKLAARGYAAERWSGNFRGWTQYRKMFNGEHVGHAPGDAL